MLTLFKKLDSPHQKTFNKQTNIEDEIMILRTRTMHRVWITDAQAQEQEQESLSKQREAFWYFWQHHIGSRMEWNGTKEKGNIFDKTDDEILLKLEICLCWNCMICNSFHNDPMFIHVRRWVLVPFVKTHFARSIRKLNTALMFLFLLLLSFCVPLLMFL